MIANSFDYYKPETLKEASTIYNQLSQEQNNVYFYSGGSEIITMSRMASIKASSVIDLKAIPECQILQMTDSSLIIGSCISLSNIKESNLFPLLGTAVGRIADHTNQNRITVGGNVCGTIIYRESVLPLLLCDADVVLCQNDNLKTVPLSSVFDKRIQLSQGEFIVQFIINKKFLNLPYCHIKKTKNEKIDYPLLTVCAIKYENEIRTAFSGLCSFPFRSPEIDNILNDNHLDLEDKLVRASTSLPEPALDNIDGSRKYRLFVFKNTLEKILTQFSNP